MLRNLGLQAINLLQNPFALPVLGAYVIIVETQRYVNSIPEEKKRLSYYLNKNSFGTANKLVASIIQRSIKKYLNENKLEADTHFIFHENQLGSLKTALAKIIESNIDYKAYQSLSDKYKTEIRNLLAEFMMSVIFKEKYITFTKINQEIRVDFSADICSRNIRTLQKKLLETGVFRYIKNLYKDVIPYDEFRDKIQNQDSNFFNQMPYDLHIYQRQFLLFKLNQEAEELQPAVRHNLIW